MTYDEINIKLEKNRTNIRLKQTELDTLNNRKAKQDKEINDLELKCNSEIESQKALALSEAELLATESIENKIKNITADQMKLTQKYEKRNGDITVDSYKDISDYGNRYKSITKINETVELVKQQVSNVVSERFCEELYNQLDQQEMELEIEELDEFDHIVDTLKAKAEKMKPSKKRIGLALIDNIMQALSPCKEEQGQDSDTLKRNLILYTATCCSLTLITVYHLSIPIILGLIFILSYNVYKCYTVYKLCLETKFIADNSQALLNRLDSKIEEEMLQDKELLDKNYSKRMSKFTTQKSRLQNLLESELNKCRDEFTFDDTAIIEKFNVIKAQYKEKDMLLKDEISTVSLSIQELENDKRALLNQLEIALGGIMKEFINFEKVSEEVIFNSRFLMHINEKNNKPVFWNHPNSSCLFIYKEGDEGEKDLKNFLELIMSQIITRLRPSCFKLEFWDQTTFGIPFSLFSSEKGEIGKTLTDKKDIDESIKSLEMLVIRREATMSPKLMGIECNQNSRFATYNQLMLETKSVPAPYKFLFIKGIENTIYESMTKLNRESGSYGIMLHYLMSEHELYANAEISLKLLDSVSNVYSIKNSGPASVSSSALQDAVKSTMQRGK